MKSFESEEEYYQYIEFITDKAFKYYKNRYIYMEKYIHEFPKKLKNIVFIMDKSNVTIGNEDG